MPGNIINLDPMQTARWPEPNFVDPSRRTWMPIYASILYAMASLTLATRLGLRATKQAGGLGVDDLLLAVAWVALSGFTGLCILGSEKYMISRHMWDVPIEGYEKIAQIAWIAEMFFLISAASGKISVLLFYRRLVVQTISRYWVWTIVAAIVFTLSYSVAFILTLFFNCSPTEAYWKSFNPHYQEDYSCVDTKAVNLLAGIFSAVSDLYSVILPSCIVAQNLRLATSQKIGLNIVALLGLLTVGASGARTYWMYKLGISSDMSACMFNVFLWSQLELSLGMTCSALPSLRVLYREYLDEPLSKLKISPKTSRNRRKSDMEEGIITQVDIPELHRDMDFVGKHTPNSSTSSNMSLPDLAWGLTPISTLPPGQEKENEIQLVQSPADYESFNLQNLEKYRQSSKARRQTVGARNPAGETIHEEELDDDYFKTWLQNPRPA